MTKATKDTYMTKDLPTAAVLLVKNQKILNIEREMGICWFIFQNKQACENVANTFWFSECLVDAKKFYQALNILKNRIFAEK